jgi:hypothetical protein
MVAYELDLNVIPGRVLPRLNVSQYDHGQTISFVLWTLNTPYSLPSGAAVSIAGTKPDGTGFIYACELQNNQPVATITEQMSAVAGEVTCELVIVVDGDRQGTINFIIDVEPAALRSDVPISETDIPVIQQIPEMVVEATEQAQIAEAWATGGEGGEASATNNAKYWAEQSQSYAVGALHWKGNTTFANIPTTDLTTGDVYNVTDAFTTDNRFNEGAGIACEAGTNIIYGNNGKWDVQAPPSVHSFNGRKGAVVPASGDYTDELVTSSAIAGKATVKAALQGLNTDKQAKTLSQAIAGQTTVEGCLSQLNTDLTAITKYIIYSDVQTDANGLAYIDRYYDFFPCGSLVGGGEWAQATFCSANIDGRIVYAIKITNSSGQPWSNVSASFGVLWCRATST